MKMGNVGFPYLPWDSCGNVNKNFLNYGEWDGNENGSNGNGNAYY